MDGMGAVIIGVFLFGGIGLLTYLFMIYNGLVALKENMKKAWTNIDVILKQRHDELPKLISVCESFA
jgi:LemA protein|tara:strand:+ start:232 stop:432 length:201 start_codon:yes stop_codon:yes gene_type:complete